MNITSNEGHPNVLVPGQVLQASDECISFFLRGSDLAIQFPINEKQAKFSRYLVTSCRPVIILRNAVSHRLCAKSTSATHQVIQQFRLGVELVDESRKAESSLSAEVDQRVKF